MHPHPIFTLIHIPHIHRYDYDDAASSIVERLHAEWMYNRELSQRLVQSGGKYTYNVDLANVR